MRDGMGVGSARWMLLFALVAVVAVAAVLATTLRSRRARLTGETTKERIDCIGRMADERKWGAAEVLADAARNEPSPEVRRAALVALGRVSDGDHRAVLEAALADADAGVRSAAAVGLGRFADEAAAKRLGELALGDGDVKVRLAAVAGLDACASDRALVYLVETMVKGSPVEVQLHARAAAQRRLRMPHREIRPEHVRLWRDDVALVKSQPIVKQAYEKAGIPLELREGDIIEEPGE